MKKMKGAFLRAIGVTLATAMMMTSVAYYAPAKEAKAASSDASMDTNNILDEDEVKDPNVLRYYTIIGNAQKEDNASVLSDISSKNAGQVIGAYGSNDKYTKPVYGTYLTEYAGKINLGGIDVKDVSGIGWARKATSIDLSSVTTMKEVPSNEFASCSGLKTMILPSSVTAIGDKAFQYCTSLTTLKMAGGADGKFDLSKISKIGEAAFLGCSEMTTLDLGKYSSTSELILGKSAFASCSKLAEVVVPIKSADNIGANIFENCKSLKKIGLYDELTYIPNAAFKNVGDEVSGGALFYTIAGGEKELGQLPSHIEYIGEYSFQGANLVNIQLAKCTALSKIKKYGFSTSSLYGNGRKLELPESLTTIEQFAFDGALIFSLDLPKKCINLGSHAFAESYLMNVKIPATVEELPEYAFWGCQLITSSNFKIESASNLVKIGDKAFAKCLGLDSTEFLGSLSKLTTIGKEAFADCYSIFEDERGNKMRDLYGDNLIASGLQEVILPNSVQVIGEKCFANNYNLKKVNLGSGIENIPDQAFANELQSNSGSKLGVVILPKDLKYIGNKAFMNQVRLETIGYTDGSNVVMTKGKAILPNGINTIGDYAFANCAVDSKFSARNATAVYVDKDKRYKTPGTGRIEVKAYIEGDKQLQTLYLNPGDFKDSTTLEDDEKIDLLITIIAKKVCLQGEGTQSATTTNKLQLPVYDLFDNEDLEDEYLYSILESYKAVEYFNEDEISNEYVEGKMSYVGAALDLMKKDSENVYSATGPTVHYMFGLKDVTIPDSLKDDNLGTNALENCFNLDKVTLSDNLTEIKDNTFNNCGGMIPNWINSSAERTLYDYYGLSSINIPEGLIKIGKNAFRGCSNLNLKTAGGTSFGRSIKTIDDNAFYGCVSLTSIAFPSTLKSIGVQSFAMCAEKNRNYEEPIREVGSSVTYYYYLNMKEYGTRKKKTGLNEVNFTAASSLEKIGRGAFEQTNITSVNLTKSQCKEIPDDMLKQCTYLETVSFQDDTEKIGANVLKDAHSIGSISLPAMTELNKDFITGEFPDYTLNVTTPEDEKMLTVPINSRLRLPINCINSDNVNGNVNIVASVDGENYVLWDKGVKGEPNSLELEADVTIDPTTKIYSLVLSGNKYIKDPIKINVSSAIKQKYAEGTHYVISSINMQYDVKVDDVPTNKVAISAKDDTAVRGNPSMYKETATSKILYLPVTNTYGVNLKSVISPATTTDSVEWESDNDCVTISKKSYEEGSGYATCTVTPNTVGKAKITCKSGDKIDVLDVYCVIPASSVIVKSSGVLLPETPKTNSASSPYQMSIGDTEKLDATISLYNGNYSEEQLKNYGDKIVYEVSDPDVIRVDEDGTIKALKKGEAVVSVGAQATGIKVMLYIKVTDSASYVPAEIKITGPEAVAVGKSIKLEAVVSPAKADQGVKWSISEADRRFAEINEETGELTGVSVGKVYVTATSKVKDSVYSQSYVVSVVNPATDFKILNKSLKIKVGEDAVISRTTDATADTGFVITPSNTTDAISWTAPENGILRVVNSTSEFCTVRGIGPGESTITGTTSSGLTATLKVTVEQPVSYIKVQDFKDIGIGQKQQTVVNVYPENATEKLTYTYQSSDPTVASVDENGIVTGLKEGSTSISVKTNTGLSSSAYITVVNKDILATGISLNATNLTLAVNEGFQVFAKKVPANATSGLTFTCVSSNPSVASVSPAGKILGVSPGSATITITATRTDGVALSASINVTVKGGSAGAKCTKITALTKKASNKTIYMYKGESTKIGYMLNPVNCVDKVTYKSNNKKVAKISALGTLKAKKKGTATITLKTTSGKTAKVKVKVVKKKKAKKVKISCASSVKQGDTIKVTAKLTSSKSTDSIKYSVNNSNADINAFGYLTARNKGKVKVTVKTSSGKKKSKTINIK